jgi:hypothetical protein
LTGSGSQQKIPRVARPLLVGVFALALLWPALVNRQPVFHPDTTACIRGADAAIEKLTGLSTAWSRSPPRAAAASSAEPPSLDPHRSLSSIEEKSVLAGRSVYYGTLLYLGHVAGGFWLSVAIQALAVALALALTLRACRLPVWPGLAVTLAVAALTSAAWYASFLMPDIFAGLAVLGCSVSIAAGAGQDRISRALWLGLLTFSLLSHSTHVLLAASLLGFGLVARAAGWLDARPSGLAPIVVALLAAIAGDAVFDRAVERFVGAPPIRPPFLMARTIDDGPGARYLRATCPHSVFVVCRFVDRLPIGSEQFLWERDPAAGVFAATDPDTRRALSAEQYRFALAVLAYDPWGQARASLRNALIQAGWIGASSFEYGEAQKRTFAAKLPAEHASRARRSAAWTGRMPIRWMSGLSYVSTGVGLGYLAYAWVRARRMSPRSGLVALRIAALAALGILVNAAICGVLSTPAVRYQARVTWLLPVLATIAHLERRRRGAARASGPAAT